MDLIYCADGNRRLMGIARAYGFKPGAQLPGTLYDEHKPLFFADQDWRNPRRETYMAALAEHKPTMATVLDWERYEQLGEVLSWAREAAEFVQKILIVPKVIDGIQELPRKISGKPVVLAYSVPTQYGGTEVPIWDFRNWPVHLLGGAPQAQMYVWRYLDNVVSVDGNYANMKATRYCEWWNGRAWVPTLRNDGTPWGKDAPYEAFQRSCKTIAEAWMALAQELAQGGE